MNMRQKQQWGNALTLFKHHQFVRFEPGLRMIMDGPFFPWKWNGLRYALLIDSLGAEV